MKMKQFKLVPASTDASPLNEGSQIFMAGDYTAAYKRLNDCTTARMKYMEHHAKGRLEGLVMAATNLGWKFEEVEEDAEQVSDRSL